ncbi:LysR family glycine cleavage system transcriptional activator [Pararhizobium capsulatum DSM 1112]|uniref:LysR family glycine cleavage system transcriptional activator n=1 Tax=Pararhizobium capsulatum DSM 1112 TaxID=1121113 RepID=A0ABU0BPX1_9HYPH|nr:LysR substrate-binding domain-containing protein [Pararhizobium capsulatum]MDQ0319520.1 LysR family glycine cleavage system transcriptional activator [Pararhizobium capsulatum DSM 1112]
MKRGRLPLTALRSFEVAGRLKSFTLAAGELFISQAAVSRQVRELEALIGKPLFTRRHRGVDLTPAGETLLSVLTGSFDMIGDCLDGLRDDGTSATVAISAEPSFAACWLVPNLPAFQKENPAIDISLDADTRLIEFRQHEASLAIRHSVTATSWSRVESRYLCDVALTPVISPVLLAQRRPLQAPIDLLDYDFLHEENRDLWHQWFLKAGTSAKPERGLVYADSGMVLQAVLRGQGVALIDTLFAQDEIVAGRLIQPFAITLPYGAYWMVARSFSGLSPAARDFAEWLTAALS